MAAEPHVDSYYAASANGMVDHPTVQGTVAADVCIVGGGYTGISAAIELAARGYDTVLVEGNRIGWGASGRNGGQIVTGFASGMDKIRNQVGEADAKILWALAEEAKSLLYERIREHAIECDLKRGYLFAAVKPRHIDELRAEAEGCNSDNGYDQFELLDRDRMGEEVASAAYCGGLLDHGGGHFHPLNYALGLARVAVAGGVRIFEGSPVIGITGQANPVIETSAGTIRAKYVVLCGNAYLGDLVPVLRRKVMPVGTYVIATEPLAESLAKRLIPNDLAVADVNFVLDYFRLSADRRMLFGGKVSYTTMPPPSLKSSMRRSMVRVFPDLAEARVDYVWGGNVAITVERSPHIGRLSDNIYFAQGFSGHGVAMTGIAGRVVAEAIAGTAERFDAFERLPHHSFVGGRLLRTPLLALAMLYFRIRDML